MKVKDNCSNLINPQANAIRQNDTRFKNIKQFLSILSCIKAIRHLQLLIGETFTLPV